MKKIIAVVATTAALIAGVSAAHGVQQDTGFTDEEIVRGLVFGEGDFAQAIDTDVALPAKLDKDVLREYEEIKDTITADLLSSSDYDTAAAISSVRSGDPYEVLDGFDQLSQDFTVSLKSNYPEALPSRTISPQVCGPTVCAAALVAAVAAVTAIAAVNFNVAGNVNMIYNQNGLWTTNGVWISGASTRGNLPNADPTQRVEEYPELVQAEVAARVAAALD